MTYSKNIGVGLLVMMLLLTGTISGVELGPPAGHEQKAMVETYAEIKCDPCDYNIDYGDTYLPGEKGGVDEGTVKLKCDPCDYNLDFGDTYLPTDK